MAQCTLLYGFRLDDPVPADHLLRRIDGALDLASCVRRRRRATARERATFDRSGVYAHNVANQLIVWHSFDSAPTRRGPPQPRLSLVLPTRSGRLGTVRSTFFKNRHGRFRACNLHRLWFVQVVARYFMPGLVEGRYVAVGVSTIMADASRSKKLKIADIANKLRARDIVSQPSLSISRRLMLYCRQVSTEGPPSIRSALRPIRRQCSAASTDRHTKTGQ